MRNWKAAVPGGPGTKATDSSANLCTFYLTDIVQIVSLTNSSKTTSTIIFNNKVGVHTNREITTTT